MLNIFGIVSVVGTADGRTNRVLSHAYAALGKGGTQVIALAQPQNAASRSASGLQVTETVCLLHTEFGTSLDERLVLRC